MGSVKSEKKSEAAKMNGKKGGRPKKRSLSNVKPKGMDVVEIIYPEGSVVVNGVLAIPVKVEQEFKKCQSPYCQSVMTKSYQRSTGTFWLCDTHKP